MNKSKLKIIILLLAIVIIAVVGIVVLNTNKKITLTNDNYEQYLSITSSAEGKNQYKNKIGSKGGSITENEYSEILMSGSVKGLSNNHFYENVEITIHFYGTIPLRKVKEIHSGTIQGEILEDAEFEETGENITIDKTVTIKCDSAGNVIPSGENSNTEQAKVNTYFNDKDIKNNIKTDITVKGTVREVR